jgi:hypothetical protein
VFKDETKKKYHTVGTAPKYHTVGTAPKYHTVGTAPKYHTVGTAPKIVERVKINTLTHKHTWPLTFLALYILYKILPF